MILNKTPYENKVEDLAVTGGTNVTISNNYSVVRGRVATLNFSFTPSANLAQYAVVATLGKSTVKRHYLGSNLGALTFYTSGDSIASLQSLTANTTYTVTGTVIV